MNYPSTLPGDPRHKPLHLFSRVTERDRDPESLVTSELPVWSGSVVIQSLPHFSVTRPQTGAKGKGEGKEGAEKGKEREESRKISKSAALTFCLPC